MSVEFSLWSENQSAEILHENAASDVVTSPGQADFETGSKGDGLAWLAFIGSQVSSSSEAGLPKPGNRH